MDPRCIAKFAVLKVQLILFCLFGCGLSVSAQIDWSQLPYQDGEEVIYDVYYNWRFVWVPAGQVTFVVTEKESMLHFEVTGKSFPSYDSVFKVRDFYSSEVDKTTLLPKHFKRDILEGKYVRFDSISFDQEGLRLREHFGKCRESAEIFDFNVEQEVHDMISAIYQLRATPIDDLPVDSNIPVGIFFDKEYFHVDINYLGIEEKKIKNLGKVETYHLQPELIDGYVFSEGDKMDIWVSVDENRLPLMIESPISIGSVKAILSSAKGLKEATTYLPY